MASVNIQDNPSIGPVGSKDADATIITSGISTNTTSTTDDGFFVYYQIENINTGELIVINSNMNSQHGGNIVSVNAATLKIILKSRTKYRVRTKREYQSYGTWVNFKTRDKRYQSPDMITQLSDDTDSTNPSNIGHKTIVVTNAAKAVEVDNTPAAYNTDRTWGPVTVTNSDTVYNDVQLYRGNPIVYTNAGATVINVPAGKNSPVQYTNAGAIITTNG